MASSGRGSKVKGSTYELKVAKELSEWSGENVHRVPQSGAGGYSWGADSRMNGDVVFPVGSRNSFVYELKKREGWDLSHLFKNIGQIKEWFSQVVTDSRRMKSHGMSPCLIFSKNRDISYVVIPYSDDVYDKLNKHFPVSRQTISFKNIREEDEYFDTLLTTLDGFKSFEKAWLFEHYQDFEWDIQNG
ncbi:holliday junction resolvase [Bacillus phage vB_BcgM]|nr:holliday junction resolvase [Bacillus phage vB_BcgM]